jgi:hypothetical protein
MFALKPYGFALLCLLVFGCQESREPTITLTQSQWEEVKQEILPAAPTSYQFPIGADFDGKIKLLGIDVHPREWKPGSEVTITWYFECVAAMERNYQVFVHLDHSGSSPARQGMDHHPVRDLYQTSRWKVGEIIRDRQKVRLRSNFPGGKALLLAGFWDPSTGRRLVLRNGDVVKNDGDNRIHVAELEIVGARPKVQGARVYVSRPLAGRITIDGKLDDEGWKGPSRTAQFGDVRGGRQSAGETWAKVTYDDTHLYIGLWGEDSDAWGSLEARDSDTWKEEVFEIFLDPDGDSKEYLELQITPRNVLFDARFAVKLGRGTGTREEQIDVARAWNGAIEHAVHVDGTLNDPSDRDKSWSAELRIAFADVPGGGPKVGDAWKVNFYRFDAPRTSDGRPGRQVAWAWSSPNGSFHNVERFGTLRFLGVSGPLDLKPGLSTDGLKKLTPPSGGLRVNPDEVQPDRPE